MVAPLPRAAAAPAAAAPTASSSRAAGRSPGRTASSGLSACGVMTRTRSLMSYTGRCPGRGLGQRRQRQRSHQGTQAAGSKTGGKARNHDEGQHELISAVIIGPVTSRQHHSPCCHRCPWGRNASWGHPFLHTPATPMPCLCHTAISRHVLAVIRKTRYCRHRKTRACAGISLQIHHRHRETRSGRLGPSDSRWHREARPGQRWPSNSCRHQEARFRRHRPADFCRHPPSGRSRSRCNARRCIPACR